MRKVVQQEKRKGREEGAEEENKSSGLQNENDICEVCGATVKCFAEINRQQVCSSCFKDMIQSRVRVRVRGGRMDTATTTVTSNASGTTISRKYLTESSMISRTTDKNEEQLLTV